LVYIYDFSNFRTNRAKIPLFCALLRYFSGSSSIVHIHSNGEIQGKKNSENTEDDKKEENILKRVRTVKNFFWEQGRENDQSEG